jgi:hypothetical protein
MRTKPREVAYVAVGAADVTVEKVRDSVKGMTRTAKRSLGKAEKTIDTLEKRGRKVMDGAGAKAKRRTKSQAVAMRRSTTTARRHARAAAGRVRASTRTRSGTPRRATAAR